MRIIVAGGAGNLGSRVLLALSERGHEAVSASRRSGVDLTTGAGLSEVLDGADAVVNCADDPRRGDRVTVAGTRRLAEAAATAHVHLVHISIVGIDAIPMSYYKRKLAAEHAIAATRGAATVLRATQFHSLAAVLVTALTKGPVTPTIGAMALQPVEIDHVAARLADLAVGARPEAYERATDVAGPDVLSVGDLAALIRAHGGRAAPRMVRLPAIGALMSALADGRLLAGPGADLGGRRFVDWLATQPPVLKGR